jgi:hypothetical protein
LTDEVFESISNLASLFVISLSFKNHVIFGFGIPSAQQSNEIDLSWIAMESLGIVMNFGPSNSKKYY